MCLWVFGLSIEGLLKMDIRTFQQKIEVWSYSLFGRLIARDIEERCLRLAEEAIELCQVAHVTPDQLYKLINYVYARPIGTAEREIAGTMVTLAAVSSAFDVDLEDASWKESNRIESEIKNKILKRQSEKRQIVK